MSDNQRDVIVTVVVCATIFLCVLTLSGLSGGGYYAQRMMVEHGYQKSAFGNWVKP